MKMKHFQRLMAFVLVLCMVIPMLPEFTLPSKAATIQPIYVIAGSDFQANTDALSADNVTNILTQIQNDGYDSVDGFLFAGDYSAGTGTTTSVKALKDAVNSVYPGLADSNNSVFIQGNHDNSDLKGSAISASGANDNEHYGVFAIHEDDLKWHAYGTEDEAKTVAANLRSYMNEKLAAGYSKPIFVISHIPLHYTMRTSLYGDGRYAGHIFDVLNDSAAAGLNIIFLFGHHHSNSWLDSQGGSATYMEKGDLINIPLNQTDFTTETLNFTYMNAGYVGYYQTPNTGVETDLNMSVFTITGGEVKICRYTASGKHEVKSAGVANNAHTEKWEPYTNVISSPHTVKLNKLVASTNGITVASDGVTGVTAKEITGNTPAGYSAYRTYDIVPTGYTEGKEAIVSIPVDSTFDASRPAVVIDHNTGLVHTCPIAGGRVTFTTYHFSDYTVAQADVSPSEVTSVLPNFHSTVVTELTAGNYYTIQAYGRPWMLMGDIVTNKAELDSLYLADVAIPNGDLWYYDGTHLRLEDDESKYIMLTGGSAYLAALDDENSKRLVENVFLNDDGMTFTIQRGSNSSYCLNQYGGTAYPHAAGYGANGNNSSGSKWYFYSLSDATATFSAVPSLRAMTTSQTCTISTGVMIDGAEQTDMVVTYASADPTVATVTEDGRVIAHKAGNVNIVVTLQEVNGIELEIPMSVNVPISVYAVSKTKSVASARGTIRYAMEQITTLDGTAGPFVIKNNASGTYQYLSGSSTVTSSECTGLEVLKAVDYSELWYFDGQYLRYNSLNGPYLSVVNGKVALSNDQANAFDQIAMDSSGKVTAYSSAAGKYLNQLGGTGKNAAGLYAANHGGWNFFGVVYDQPFSLNVMPGTPIVKKGETVKLTASVLIDDIGVDTYTVTWASANTAVATVSDGVVTGVAAGKTTVTCTLTSVNGDSSVTHLVAEIPVEVTAGDLPENIVIASGFTTSEPLGTQVTNITPGTPSGPYIIKQRTDAYYMTGNGPVVSNKCTGLELATSVDYAHVWYYDGAHLRYNSPDGPYLAVENGQVTLSNADTYAFDSVARYVNSDGTLSTGYLIGNTHISGYQYLNRLGGLTNNAAGLWAGDGSSRWYLYEVGVHKPVTLSVVSGSDLILNGETLTLTPAVSVSGAYTNTYTINWASSDTSVATVSNGKVTAVKRGRAIITATLTAADGMGTNISVEIPISVADKAIASNYVTSITTTIGPQLVPVSRQPAGVGGPYVIYNQETLDTITGVEGFDSGKAHGLWLKPHLGGDYTDLWYFDGSHLIYGDPNASDRFMVVQDGQVSLGGNVDEAFDSVTLNALTVNSFTIANSHLSGSERYLNQRGGKSYYAAGLYSEDAIKNSGSAWAIYSLSSETEAQFAAWPGGHNPNLMIDEIKQINHNLYFDGAWNTNYTVSYSVSDPSVANISKTGILYPVKAGTVTVYVKFETVNGTPLAEDIIVPVTINVSAVQSISVSPAEGSLPVRASQRMKIHPASDGADAPMITVTYDNGSTKTVPLIAEYLTDANGNTISTAKPGVYKDLTVTYQGVAAPGKFTLQVLASELPDYPEYPEEGSVIIDKTATGKDFASSGLAEVELSVNGVPSKKGADIIIMLDTSSSMARTVVGAPDERLNVLCASLNNLINGFQRKAADGTNLDIRVAVADFNGFYHDEYSTYYIDPNDTMSGTTIRDGAHSSAKVYTNATSTNKVGTLDASAFIKVQEMGLNPFTTSRSYKGETTGKYMLTMGSGTNYDYAFDAVYQMGQAINDANAETGEDRDLFVIFMSDGSPFQYNYFGSQSSSPRWSKYLMGQMTDEDFGPNANKSYYREDGKHWMAEAIKGATDKKYNVIRKNDYRDTDGDNFIQIDGLGATLYSIGFCLEDDNQITEESMNFVINHLATSENYAFFAKTASELQYTFDRIASDIMYAASGAYFIDTMGKEYDLKLGDHSYQLNGVDTVFKDNKIQVKSYEIYTMADYENSLCTLEQIGMRKTNNGTPIVDILETITFNSAGTEAYSNLIYTTNTDGTVTYTNILVNGIITAKNFWYNTTASAKDITLDDGSTYSLPAETFYWKVGTITTKEMALSYFVYLTKTMSWDGASRTAGIYPTNESAILYYENYLGNDCHLAAPIPTMPWGKAQVGYGFYLVDENGTPMINKISGQTGSFQMSVKLGNVVYTEFTTNSGMQSIIANQLTIPENYKLFDSDAEYYVSLNSDGAGQMAIRTNGLTLADGTPVFTSYVTGYTAQPYVGGDEDATLMMSSDFMTANTVVWFALVSTMAPEKDSVVIDYGLPVDIHPLDNDTMLADKMVLAGIGQFNSNLTFTTALDSSFIDLTATDPLNVDFGTAQIMNNGADDIEDAVVRYVLTTMKMDKESTFSYAVHYTGNAGRNGYYYSTITVIPATTIYYEDNFEQNTTDGIQYAIYDVNGNKIASEWSPAATQNSSVQDEDRPGEGLKDALKNYGYDSHYTNFTTHSMGGAKKVNVNANKYATATFTFKGTGFDVISVTSGTTGTIVVTVTDENDVSQYYIVDTYYGYSYQNKQWIITPTPNNDLYQIPVMKVDCGNYGKYTVTITATYADYFDHTPDDGYDFYLDAIRIYDPAGEVPESTVVQGAYIADGEGWPSYEELRNLVIDANTFDKLDSSEVNGAVFLDSKATNYHIADYRSFGPNNELYLAENQAIAFMLNKPEDLAKVQLAMKNTGSSSVTATITSYNATTKAKEQTKTVQLTTSTDLYYNITEMAGKYVVIKNTGNGILSITNIKTTYTSQPGAQNQSVLSLRKSAIQDLVAALNASEDLEQLPATGDMGMSFVMMVLTASMFMLAVLVLPNTRKRNAK